MRSREAEYLSIDSAIAAFGRLCLAPGRQKTYVLATEPARFTQFDDKVKNNPGWTVHTLPCTTFMQLEMPDELTAILLKAIP